MQLGKGATPHKGSPQKPPGSSPSTLPPESAGRKKCIQRFKYVQDKVLPAGLGLTHKECVFYVL